MEPSPKWKPTGALLESYCEPYWGATASLLGVGAWVGGGYCKPSGGVVEPSPSVLLLLPYWSPKSATGALPVLLESDWTRFGMTIGLQEVYNKAPMG